MIPRKSDIWLAIGWLAVTAGIGVLLLQPTIIERRELMLAIGQRQSELTTPDAGPEMIAELSETLEALKSISEGHVTLIPEESDVAGLMQSLDQTLRELQLDQHDVMTNRVKELKFAMSMPVTLTLSGTFPRVYQAIARIESLPRLIRMDRLRISSHVVGRDTIDREGIVRAELSISAFFAPRSLAEVNADGGE